MNKEQLKQGDRITFYLNEKATNQTGKVCGKIGPVVIVELETALEGYPYTHIYIVDTQIK